VVLFSFPFPFFLVAFLFAAACPSATILATALPACAPAQQGWLG
jgi:hypothetical protein